MTLSATTRSRIETYRNRYPHPRSAVLPSLWAVQDEAGHVTPEGMAEVAALLGLAPSEVEGVSTFYSMYFQHPPGRHSIVVCDNVPCGLRGSDTVIAHLERRLGCPSGGTTADGAFTWERTVECLGACEAAPVMQLDHHTRGDLSPDRVDRILDRMARS
ncbi:MAG: NADH-quinone oxidoreductase subunit NuoE [Candidatus Dormibacteria bacterium]